jgi:hypothetical protein
MTSETTFTSAGVDDGCEKCKDSAIVCNVCGCEICDGCIYKYSLCIEYMPSPSLKRRVYLCKKHIHTPLRTYDTAKEISDKSEDEACAL